MMQEINERVAKVETRVDILEDRATRHGNEIDGLRLQNKAQDSKLDSIDKKVTESCEVTRSIKGGIDTIKWLFGLGIAAYTLYEIATKMGWL